MQSGSSRTLSAVLLMLTLVLAGCGGGKQQASQPATQPAQSSGQSATQSSSSPIKIGYVGGFTGSCADLATSNVQGIEFAAAEINAAGGLLGRPIEVLRRDSKTRPEEGVLQMRRLILEDKVDFILGPCSSAVAMAMNQLAKQQKKLMITSVANTHRATEEAGNDYFFQVVPNTRMEGRAAALAAAKMPYKRYVTVGLDYEWGRVLVDVFEKKLKELRPDVEIVNKYWPKLGETDFSPFITSIMKDKPEVVFGVLFGPASIAFVRQAKPLGLFNEVKNFMTLMTVDVLIPLKDDLPEGLRVWARAPFFALEGERVSDFVKKYQEKYGNYPDDWAIMGYDAMLTLAEGVKKAETVDNEKVSAALKGLEVDGLRGTFQIRAFDGMASVPIFVGTTAADPKYPFRILKDVERIPGDQIWATEEEIKQFRASQKS